MADEQKQSEKDTSLVQEIINCQRSLYAYISRLLFNSADAKDVLQETNLILLSKQDEYAEVRDFSAWVAKIAYYQVMAFRSKQKRNRVQFSEALVQTLAEEAKQTVSGDDPSLKALGQCIMKLPDADQQLIKQRYCEDLPARKIATLLKRSSHAVSQSLYRVRLILLECVRRTLAREEQHDV